MSSNNQSPASLTGKYRDVLRPFIVMMESELQANAHKGDRHGWLSMSRQAALHEIYYHVGKLEDAVKNDSPELIQEYAADVANMAMMLLDVCGGLSADDRDESPSGLSVSPIAFQSSHSVSPSFDCGEHQLQERQIALAERTGVKADLYRVDMGVLGEIYVKPEVASDRFKQLKHDRAPVKAVYPMYQGAALPNKVDAIDPAGAPHP